MATPDARTQELVNEKLKKAKELGVDVTQGTKIRGMPEMFWAALKDWDKVVVGLAEELMSLLCEGLGVKSEKLKELSCLEGSLYWWVLQAKCGEECVIVEAVLGAIVINIGDMLQVPIIAMVMGEKGLMSRVLCPKFGEYLTFGTLKHGKVSAPGQPTIRDSDDHA
ncbi:1-aminocyclopropane-1-carboxylate oxidase homolog 3-like protein [Tanacetum coccineum]